MINIVYFSLNNRMAYKSKAVVLQSEFKVNLTPYKNDKCRKQYSILIYAFSRNRKPIYQKNDVILHTYIKTTDTVLYFKRC